MAASAINLDSEPRTLIVTEGGSKSELALAGGETVNFCPSGCFVTMPNGDLEALTGRRDHRNFRRRRPHQVSFRS